MSSISAGTTSTTTLVHSGDTTGSLVFKTNDTGSGGTTAVTIDTSQRAAFVAGTVALPAITTSGDTNTGIFFPAADTIAFAEGGTEAMRIDSSGNVGIGTTSPSYRIDAVGNGTPSTGILRTSSNFTNSTTKYGYYTVGHYTNATAPFGFIQGESNSVDNSVHIGGGAGETTAATRIDFYTAANNTTTVGTERMRIDSSGNLLVGVTSPSGGFNTIAATGSNWALVAKNLSTSGSVYGFKSLLSYAPNNTSSYFIGCEDNGTGRMYVYSNGNVVNTNNSYGAISDRTLKENIVDASPKLENLCKVKIRNFNLIGETTKQLGVVAQELEEIFPSMVEVDGNTQKKQVKYSVFVPMLVKAIQELKAINDQQAETINALTARIVALEGQ